MRKLFLLSITFTAQILLKAQTEKIIPYLPEKVNMVMAMNPVKIANYIPGDVFRQSSLYLEMMKGDGGQLRALMANPGATGIDITKDLMLTVTIDSTEDDNTITALFGTLQDEAAFTATIQKMLTAESKIETNGNNKLMMNGPTGPALSWNNEVFVFTTGRIGSLKKAMSQQFEINDKEISNDTIAAVTDEPVENIFNMDSAFKVFQNDLRKLCAELLSKKQNSNLIQENKLMQLLSQKGDIKMWNRGGGGFGNSLKKMPPQIATALGKLKLFPNNISTTIINFENGKIAADSKNYINEEQNNLYKKYGATQLNKSLLNKIPAFAKPMILFTGSANPDMGKEMMEKAGIASMLNDIKDKLPFRPELISLTFGNSGLFTIVHTPSFDDMLVKKKRSKEEEIFKNMHVLFAMPIKDKKNFLALKDSVDIFFKKIKAEKLNEKERNPETKFVDVFGEIKTATKFNDSLFVFSTSENLATAYINNNTNTNQITLPAESNDYPIYVNLGFKNLMETIYKTAGSPSEKKDIEALKIFQKMGDMQMMGGRYDNGVVHSKMEMKMGDPDQNSFLQIFEFINMAAEAKGKERETNKETNEETFQDAKIDVDAKEPPPPPQPAPPVKKTTRNLQSKSP